MSDATPQLLSHLDRILVVGFAPFQGRLQNGSQTLAEALEKNTPRGAVLEALVLPVAWGSVEQLLMPKLKAFAPSLVLGLGEGKPGQITLERAARNARSGVDECGARAENEWVEMDGAEVINSRLSYRFQRPKELAFPLVLSEDAGEFLCNSALYRCLESPVPSVGFVHVPPQELADDAAYLGRLLPFVLSLIEHNRASHRGAVAVPGSRHSGATGS